MNRTVVIKNKGFEEPLVYQPETYAIALFFMVVSMLCWGSWANTVKLCPTYRFQLFYCDTDRRLSIERLAHQ